MAFLEHAIDLGDLPESAPKDFSPIPEGWYSATINKAELKPTKDGSGEYIAIRYDITGPTHQGRVIFGNINIKNRSEKAEAIGRAQLGDLMRSLGLSRLTDTDQLIGGELQISVSISPKRVDEATGKTYEARNEVKNFRTMNGVFVGDAEKPAAKPASKASSGSAPPWAKK